MKNNNYNLEALAVDFINCEIDIYGLEDIRGMSFDELYPFGNDSLDSDIHIYLDKNQISLTEEEMEIFVEHVYCFEINYN